MNQADFAALEAKIIAIEAEVISKTVSRLGLEGMTEEEINIYYNSGEVTLSRTASGANSCGQREKKTNDPSFQV
jgi:hypothetical protein